MYWAASTAFKVIHFQYLWSGSWPIIYSIDWHFTLWTIMVILNISHCWCFGCMIELTNAENLFPKKIFNKYILFKCIYFKSQSCNLVTFLVSNCITLSAHRVKGFTVFTPNISLGYKPLTPQYPLQRNLKVKFQPASGWGYKPFACLAHVFLCPGSPQKMSWMR